MGSNLAAAAAATSVLTGVLLALALAGWRRLLVEREGRTRAAELLTGEQLRATMARLTRRSRVVGVVILRIDGPIPGDLARAVLGGVRASDLVGPGAEGELVVLLPGSTAGQAVLVARRVQEAVAPVTVCVGVSHGTGLDLPDLVRTAHEALRRSRRRLAGGPVPV